MDITGSLSHTGSIFQNGNIFLKPDFMSGFTTNFVTQSVAIQSSNILGINNNNIQFTGSVQVYGSNNILLQAQRITTPVGSQGIVSGSNNIITAGIPRLQSGSIAIPLFENNIGNNVPVITTNFSGSAVTSVSNNLGNLGFTVNSNSGSTQVSQNNIQGGLIVTNNTSSSFASQASVQVNRNVINGFGHTLSFSGNTVGGTGTSKLVNDCYFGGNTSNVFSNTTDNTGSLLSTLIYGNNLIVTASNTNTSTTAGGLAGSAYLGRFNEGGTLANSFQTVFAVGTGTSTGARRTSLLVSGSGLTVVRNGLDVSGSLGVTGSLSVTGNVLFASGADKTMGTVALDGGNPGSATVSNTLVTANSLIFLTKQTLSNAHMVAVTSKGSSTFTITSNGNGDADTVAYLIINPS
jgi:hypothetical protein